MSKLFGTLSSVRGPLAGKTIPEMIQTLLTPVKNLPVNLGDVANEINNIIEKVSNLTAGVLCDAWFYFCPWILKLVDCLGFVAP